jgi:hypothetical protein
MELAAAIGGLIEKFGAAMAVCVILASALVYLFKLLQEQAKTAALAVETSYKDRLAESRRNTEDVLTGLNASTNTIAVLTNIVTERNVILSKQNEMIVQLLQFAERDRPYWQERIGRLEDTAGEIKEDTGEVRRDVGVILQDKKSR